MLFLISNLWIEAQGLSEDGIKFAFAFSINILNICNLYLLEFGGNYDF